MPLKDSYVILKLSSVFKITSESISGSSNPKKE